MNKIVLLILPLFLVSCSDGGGDLFNWSGPNYKYDTLTFRLDSLSYWDTGAVGGSQYSFSCNNVVYNQFNISFFGKTNIDSANIIGSPFIEYRIFENGTQKAAYEKRGYTNINKYHSLQEYSKGDSVYFHVGFTDAQGLMLKYVKLYSLIMYCIRWYY